MRSFPPRPLWCADSPRSSFREDPLSLLRSLSASSGTGSPLSGEEESALWAAYPLLKSAPKEEVFSLLLSLLCGRDAGRILRKYTEIFTFLLPPLKATVGYEQQNPHHLYTVWEHTVRAVENVPPDPLLRLVMLLHDTGKPLSRTTDENGIGHYKGHQQISARLSRQLLEEYHCPPDFIDRVTLLVEAHDIPLSTDPVIMRRRLRKFGEENLRALFLIHQADRIATGTRNPLHAREHARELSEVLDGLLDSE